MPIRVLCVDDEELFLDLMRVYLGKDTRLEVHSASSVDDALELLGKDEYDVIVSDYQMPGSDGLDFLKIVRDQKSDMPFILLTGRGREYVAIRALNEGADFYLQKTDDPSTMFGELVNMIIQSNRRWCSEKAREDAWQRYEAYAEKSRDFVYRLKIKPVPKIEYFSPCVEDLVGYPAEEFYKNPALIYSCIHPDDLERFSHAMDNPVVPEKPVIFRWVHKDGRVVYAEDTWVPVRDKSGEVVGIDGMSRDVTDRVKAQEALAQANRKLELIGSLIRHDTLNRVTSILGNVDLIRASGGESLEARLDRIETDAKLIARQLQFSSDFQRTVSEVPLWIPLQDAVEKACSSWNLDKVVFDIKLADVEVLSDYVLERIFSNLVEDSLRHGEHVTRITVHHELTDAGLDVIYEDDGIGIPVKEKELIFERGFGKGSGYGLFLTRGILAVSGVTIKETGEFGKGVRFVIHFPRDASRIRRRAAGEGDKDQQSARA